jgi:glycerol-3-phosphate acyltransferase PlsY
MMNIAWLIILLGYFLGSIPTAYIAGRLRRGKDIRQMGDGNMGAANAFRELGAKAGLTVFFVDAGKGALAILIAQNANLPQIAVLLTGVAAVIGHNWPAFLGFRGGRGEATTIGVLATLMTLPMLLVGGIAGIAFLINRRVILGQGPFLFPPLPLVCWGLGFPGVLIAYSVALPCLVGFTHFLRTRRVADTSETGSA